LKNILEILFKNAKFGFFDFCQNINLVVLPTSKYKKQFLDNFEHLCPGNFFHETFSFFSKKDFEIAIFGLFLTKKSKKSSK
jgi:hypothetical protein